MHLKLYWFAICENTSFCLNHFSFILVFVMTLTRTYISDFGLPSNISTQPLNPHCLCVTWKKAIGSVTGYRVYCFPDDSEKAEVTKTISDGNQDSVVISGLRPDKKYRIGITSLSSETESKLVSIEEQQKMCKSSKRINLNYFLNFCVKDFFILNRINCFNLLLAGIHHLVLDQNLTVLKKNLIPDEVIRRMLEETSMEHFDLLTDKQEERIQRFIECLQESSVEDYKYFIKLLYETKQEPLITKLVTSCKTSFITVATVEHSSECVCLSVCMLKKHRLHILASEHASLLILFKCLLLGSINSDQKYCHA